jgi:hypothetical protein
MKITRSAFLYLEGDDRMFAQCGTCVFGKSRCAIMGNAKVSAARGSCNFYINGPPTSARDLANLTAEQAGYVERLVRCEHCRFYGASHCGLSNGCAIRWPCNIRSSVTASTRSIRSSSSSRSCQRAATCGRSG